MAEKEEVILAVAVVVFTRSETNSQTAGLKSRLDSGRTEGNYLYNVCPEDVGLVGEGACV